MTFDPMAVEVTCVTLPKDHCVQVPWEYINVCGYSDQFCKFIYIHILRTTYIHTHTYYVQNEWSHSLLLNSVQARQKYWNCLKIILRQSLGGVLFLFCFVLFPPPYFFFFFNLGFIFENFDQKVPPKMIFCHFLKKSSFLVKFGVKNRFSDSFPFQKCVLLHALQL